MPHITTCTRCGRSYEEVSEETAGAPSRECNRCAPSSTLTLADWYRGVVSQVRTEAGFLILVFEDEGAAMHNPFYAIGTPICYGGYMNAIELQ